MSITVSEKEHWKERIAKRIDQRIETLVAKQDPTLLQRVTQQAVAKAYESLVIAVQQRELDEIDKRKEEMAKRERRLRAEQCAIINGTGVEDELEKGGHYSYYPNDVLNHALSTRANALEADILAESELGRQIISLRVEKDNLLDTVWLATSSTQIKQLWEQVNALLGVTPTPLEDKALKIPPVQEGTA